MYPNIALLLHSDDFCKGFEDIPTVNGYPDCDGPRGVDFACMVQTLDYIQANAGKTPPDFESWQADAFPGQEERALKVVSLAKPRELSKKVKRFGWVLGGSKLVIVDGFTLYNIEKIRRRLDIRLCIRLSYETAKRRRIRRQGYGLDAKPEEFRKTKEYFEKMVWRNYVAEHAALFKSGDVEGFPDDERSAMAGIEQ